MEKKTLLFIKYQDYGLHTFARTPNEAFFGQTNWADKFWGIWGIFGRFISTYFDTVSPLCMFSINRPLCLQKTKPLYPDPKYLFVIGI